MFNKNKIYNLRIFSMMLVILILSCTEEIIEIDLTDYRDTIVIEATMTNIFGLHQVKISKVSYIFESSEILPVSDAYVTITDEQGNIAPFKESEPGLYLMDYNMIGIPGKKYTLTVIVEGEEYTATSVMPEPIRLDQISFHRFSPRTPEYFLVGIFQDRAGEDDFCRINFYRNGYYLAEDMILYQGEYTDGEEIFIDNLNNYFYRMDRVEIEVISLNRNIYEYYSYLENTSTDNNGDDEIIDIFEMGHANPKSNISNGALGYFSAQYYSYYNVIVR